MQINDWSFFHYYFSQNTDLLLKLIIDSFYHSIGYPVVTLGFGFKTYVGYRMRQRRQKEVQKVNEYYYDFLREGLPPGPIREEAFNPHPSPNPCKSRYFIFYSSKFYFYLYM